MLKNSENVTGLHVYMFKFSLFKNLYVFRKYFFSVVQWLHVQYHVLKHTYFANFFGTQILHRHTALAKIQCFVTYKCQFIYQYRFRISSIFGVLYRCFNVCFNGWLTYRINPSVWVRDPKRGTEPDRTFRTSIACTEIVVCVAIYL